MQPKIQFTAGEVRIAREAYLLACRTMRRPLSTPEREKLARIVVEVAAQGATSVDALATRALARLI